MLTNNLTLDGATGTEVTYNLISQDSTGTRRVDTASTLAEPSVLQIKHSVQGSGADAVDRHLISLSANKLSSGKPRAAVINFTAAVPRDSVITSAIVLDLIAQLVDLITDGGFSGSGFAGTTNLTAFLRGES